jgi:hypothetical protein
MALVACAECKNPISDDALICPQCGVKPKKKTSMVTWIVGGIFLVVMYKSCGTINEKLSQNSDARAGVSATSLAAKEAAAAKGWDYYSRPDEMTSKVTKFAELKSVNSLSLDPPYSGSNYGRLVVRKKTGKAEELFLRFEQGQSMCRSYSSDCSVSVRFDNAQPVNFAGQTPSDGSTETVFLMPVSKFLGLAKKAKKIKVALEIYHAGTQVFEFEAPAALTF